MKLPRQFERWQDHITIALPGARVLFTTRRGGFSTGPFESLNLGRLTDDDPDAVERNRVRLAEQVARRLSLVRQVHGSSVRLAGGDGGAGEAGESEKLHEADGIVTRRPDIAPTVLVADCLPVAVAGDGVVGMLHAGWRGLAAGILEQGVRALRDAGAHGELKAAIGPGVGSCCYEVGDEVQRAFTEYGPAVRSGRNLDLSAVARIQLKHSGVAVVHHLDLCTSCSPELFFSHRRDRGITGRQSGVAWLS